MDQVLNLFQEHPASQGETYGQHAKFALSVAFYLMAAAMYLAIHAVLPFVCAPISFNLDSTRKFLNEKCDNR